MKYDIGDTLKVREDLDVGKIYGDRYYYSEEMVGIKEIIVKDTNNVGYESDIDGLEGYYWSEEMIVGKIGDSKPLATEHTIKSKPTSFEIICNDISVHLYGDAFYVEREDFRLEEIDDLIAILQETKVKLAEMKGE